MAEFGESFTAHMVTSEWTVDGGWGPLELGPHAPVSVPPSMVGLHYGQVVFEGLKVYRQADGSVGIFRAQAHAARLADSARRLVIPPLPEPMFLKAVDLLTAANQDSLPRDAGSGLSLYLRPLLFASDSSLALRPARSYKFVLIAFVTEGFFADEPDPLPVWVSPVHTRAAPGGTGNVKFAGNYAPTYWAQEEARMAGCRQVVWLDAIERRWVEELGGMNIFFVRGSGSTPQVVTPPLGGTLLPGVTRDTLLNLSGRLGYEPREERVSVSQWQEECNEGTITETFACGTAAAVTPVGTVRYRDVEWNVGTGMTGPVTADLRQLLTNVQTGRVPSPEGWIRFVPAPTPRNAAS
ncbi:branched-chain amino acid aminotransferase [Streptomyces prasinus]|uniref:Branched-chain-amino-acid aminotransferase n=1 Tax=Streptomyces prasinus TaxID=67345 RepID=A0ABX6ASK5_9ACTN|nr:branched-chain amino acid aminotransferase [Streptomyces prasinus]QEV05010.1 branched-chain amino acid aminotransferase [Streptomyces prasinus]